MKRVEKLVEHPVFLATLKELQVVEADRIYCTHNLEHLLSVARIMTIQNLEKNLKIPPDWIYSVALLHDIGRLHQYKTGEKHPLVGSEMAVSILKDCDFSPEETKELCLAIKTHNNQEETNQIGQLLRFSDKLSRNCFICPGKDSCKWPEDEKNRGITI